MHKILSERRGLAIFSEKALMIAAALTCMALLRFSASSVAASMAGMIAFLAEFISVFACQTITAHKLEAQFHDMRDAMKDDD